MSLIYVDANVFITAFETEPAVAMPVRDLIRAAWRRPHCLATSELTLAELLAPVNVAGSLSPTRRLELYRTLLIENDAVQLLPVTRTILMETATVRAAHRQKLPDAIHIATALEAGSRYFCSSDRDSRRLPPELTAVKPDALGISILLSALAS